MDNEKHINLVRAIAKDVLDVLEKHGISLPGNVEGGIESTLLNTHFDNNQILNKMRLGIYFEYYTPAKEITATEIKRYIHIDLHK